MKLSFKKRKQGTSVLICTRKDGSTTWSSNKQSFFIVHDLIHYAVESTLNFKQAFFGLLEKYSIQDFELEKSKRPQALQPKNLPKEALQAEFIVGLLQAELSQQNEDNRFLITLQKVLSDNKLEMPLQLTEEALLQMRSKIYDLHNQWVLLHEGESIELIFDV